MQQTLALKPRAFVNPTFKPRIQSSLRPVPATRGQRETSFFANDSLPEYHTLDVQNTVPDYDNEKWMEKVTDWDEFWAQDVWVEEAEGLDDEHDARTKYLDPSTRMFKMLNSLQNAEKKSQIIFTAQIANLREHTPGYEEVEATPDDRSKVYANLTESDLRAISEKRKKAALAEVEKQRYQARSRRVHHLNHECDARLLSLEGLRLNSSFTDEEIQNLITDNGVNCDPAKHGGHVKNPWLNVDYANELGRTYTEEMEEFLQRIGHWAPPSLSGYLTYEVDMAEGDFDDFQEATVEVQLAEEGEEDEVDLQDILNAASTGNSSDDDGDDEEE